jgi:hypothetical protein
VNVQLILERGRLLAQLAMVDTCSVSRPTRGALNETTGAYAETSAAVYYGPCKVSQAQPAVTDVAGVAVELLRPVLELPAGSATLVKGDVVTLTSGAMSGRVLTVVGESPSTTQVARRWLVDVVT